MASSWGFWLFVDTILVDLVFLGWNFFWEVGFWFGVQVFNLNLFPGRSWVKPFISNLVNERVNLFLHRMRELILKYKEPSFFKYPSILSYPNSDYHHPFLKLEDDCPSYWYFPFWKKCHLFLRFPPISPFVRRDPLLSYLNLLHRVFYSETICPLKFVVSDKYPFWIYLVLLR